MIEGGPRAGRGALKNCAVAVVVGCSTAKLLGTAWVKSNVGNSGVMAKPVAHNGQCMLSNVVS